MGWGGGGVRGGVDRGGREESAGVAGMESAGAGEGKAKKEATGSVSGWAEEETTGSGLGWAEKEATGWAGVGRIRVTMAA